MRAELRPRSRLARISTLAAIALAGLVSIVGSGGGGGLGSVCDTYPDSCAPPSLQVQVVPSEQIAQVGTSAIFDALPSVDVANINYQWQRSDAASVNFVDLPGATAARLTLSSVNLSDDGARFQVVAYITGYETTTRATALGQLTVVSAAPVRLQDTEFEPANWAVNAYLPPGAAAFTAVAEQVPTGGASGAYQRTSFTVPAGTSSVRVLHVSARAVYEPRLQGAIYAIDHAFDCAGLVRGTATAINLRLLIEQGGQRFVGPAPTVYCHQSDWSNAVRQLSLRARDFALLGGVSCAAGGPCPDFSADAPALRFGLLSTTNSYPSEAAAYGIDNWDVSIWRR